ncbi:MAG: GAF domain-containing protein [Dehalococcoidia bacterium]
MPQKQSSSAAAAATLAAADVELLHQALRDAEKRAALLTELIEALNQSRDAISLLQRSVEAVGRAIAASGAFVYLWDSDAGRFVMKAATEGHQKAFVGRISLRPGEGITGWSALMRRPVLVSEQLSTDPRVVIFPELQENEFRSCLIVPILVPGGETLGVFSIYSTEEGSFTETDLFLVDEVAKLLASGIDRAHVVDLWERQSVALDSLIGAAEAAPIDVRGCLTDLAHRAIGIVPSDICVVESLETDGSPCESVALALRHDVETDDDGGGGAVVALSIAAAKEMARSTSPSLQAATVPMRLGERTLGVLTSYRNAAFTADDRSLLAAIASYGAFALHGLTNRGNAASALGRLIAEKSQVEAAAMLERFGWAPGTSVVPVVVRCDPELALTSQRSLESVAQTVESVFTGKRRRSVPATAGVVGALVIGSADRVDQAGIAAELQHDITVALIDKGQLVGAGVGIGRPADTALAIVTEFRAAAEASIWAALTGEGVRTALVGDQDMTRQLLTLGTDLGPAITEQVARISQVKAHDERNGTDLLETMEIFVRERGSIQQASELLFIHRNTLRQRLNKISSLIEQPIEQVEDWLPVSLAIRVLRAQQEK